MEDDTIEEKLENCRIGRNCQARFWCGFCSQIIGLESKGLDAWTERFDHIDDHFMGNHGLKKQCILDWISVDSRRLKGESLRNKDYLDPISPSGTTMKRHEKLLKNTDDSFIIIIENSALDTGMSSQINKEMTKIVVLVFGRSSGVGKLSISMPLISSI